MEQQTFRFTLLSFFTAVIGLVALLTVIFILSPYNLTDSGTAIKIQYNWFSVGSMYISLFVFFSGLFSTFFFLLENNKRHNDDLYILATTSMRRGILIGILACVLLFMQSLDILIWWDMLLVMVAVILLEMYLGVKN